MSDMFSCLDLDPAEVLDREGGRYLKGKGLDLDCAERGTQARNSLGHKFWARGYFGSTVGCDEEMMIRNYIKQKSANGRPAIGSVATEARVLISSILVQNPL